MGAKQTAVEKAEFILLFMSQLYSESHEMAMEYTLIKDGEDKQTNRLKKS